MTYTKYPEALRLAALYDADAWPSGLSLNAWAAASAAELRRLHAENATLKAGYDAARLEIDHLRGATKTVAQPAGEYPPLPEPYHVAYDDIDKEDVKCFAEGQLRAYVDTDRAMRAQAAPYQGSAS